MKPLWRILLALVVGLTVTAVVYVGVGVFTTWGVIHSGWSRFEVNLFFLGVTIASVAVGVLVGWWTYFVTG
jgi:hypothetical protein